MTSSVSKQFQNLFKRLPGQTQTRARSKLALWNINPHHPSLHFKRVSQTEPIWSLRVTDDYQILDLQEGNHMEWFWIGPHSEYDQLLKRLQGRRFFKRFFGLTDSVQEYVPTERNTHTRGIHHGTKRLTQLDCGG